VKMGEVLGSVDERSLTAKIFHGEAKLTDKISQHMDGRLPLIGSLESIGTARERLQDSDTLMVTFVGSPVGILTRHDLLTYMSK
jgi:cystathionine beta-synthase